MQLLGLHLYNFATRIVVGLANTISLPSVLGDASFPIRLPVCLHLHGFVHLPDIHRLGPSPLR
jgi:hypothetical protein